MSKHLSKEPNLAIISDTSISSKNNYYSAFEPVVREVDHLAKLFKSVDWIGFYAKKSSCRNYKIPNSTNINLLPMKRSGGDSFLKKIQILFYFPSYIVNIAEIINRNDIIYLRGPSVPALLGIFFSFFKKNRIYLFKYAGGWELKNIPISYAFQKWILNKQKKILTIVSFSSKKSKNILEMLNPCLNKKDFKNGYLSMMTKNKYTGINICFAGRCDKSKGIFEVLDTINILADNNIIKNCFIAGSGDIKSLKTKLNKNAKELTTFCGVLTRSQLNKVYAKSNFILLPTRSEGFPKVLAEAAAYGCVPIVSTLPGISKIMAHNKEGMILDDTNPKKIADLLIKISMDKKRIRKLGKMAHMWSFKFSYDNFIENMKHLIK